MSEMFQTSQRVRVRDSCELKIRGEGSIDSCYGRFFPDSDYMYCVWIEDTGYFDLTHSELEPVIPKKG